MTKDRIRMIDIDKFESFIFRTNGCWWWTGSIDKRSGKGMFGKRSAPTIAYELYYNIKLEHGMIVKQICNNVKCVRKDHLQLARKTFPGR